jgi:D-alanyl-D-alanine carboxypeptidase
MRTRLFAALLCLVSSAGMYAQTFDTAKLDLLFDRLLEKNKGMGGLTVARDGKVIYSRSFGYSEITDTNKRPLNADTKYRIASITKLYTAVMIFQLVEEGRLTLADTLDKFFPEIPNASRITIAHILHHRSGIPDISPDGAFGRQPRTQEEIVARIAQGKPHFEPDTMHRYSNTGYNLLGFIVEKASGKPYSDALRDRITSRLGLRNTYAGTGKMDPAKNEALSYSYLGSWRRYEEIDFSVVAGAGRIVSTTADMAAFIKGIFDLKLISKESLALMTTMRDGEGMGFEPHSFASRTCYGHTGGSASSGAWLTYCPEEKLALAYATNAKIYPVRDIVTRVRRLLEPSVPGAVARGVQRQRGRARPVRRELHDSRNASEDGRHEGWRDAFHPADGAESRPSRGHGGEYIPDRAWRNGGVRRRERSDDD